MINDPKRPVQFLFAGGLNLSVLDGWWAVAAIRAPGPGDR